MKRCYFCMKQLQEGETICPYCHRESSHEVSPEQLEPGTLLHEKFLVGHALGQGGFGITYMGYDTMLDLRVAIKEYFPSGFATRIRGENQTVSCSRDGGEGWEFFEGGKERFLQEARNLAKFAGEPGIVTVRDFFAENNTAYIVMEYLEGETLKTYLERVGVMEFRECVSLLQPVMKSMQKLHLQGLIHRDISPDNIMLGPDTVKLLDFGATRDVSPVGNKSLSIILKPGFAPEEQYRSRGQQGPWTDVYALSATIYKCITGVTPDESTQRVFSDELESPSSLGIDIDLKGEQALLKGLAVYYQNRYQNMSALQAGLLGEEVSEQKQTVVLQTDQRTGAQHEKKPERG